MLSGIFKIYILRNFLLNTRKFNKQYIQKPTTYFFKLLKLKGSKTAIFNIPNYQVYGYNKSYYRYSYSKP